MSPDFRRTCGRAHAIGYVGEEPSDPRLLTVMHGDRMTDVMGACGECLVQSDRALSGQWSRKLSINSTLLSLFIGVTSPVCDRRAPVPRE